MSVRAMLSWQFFYNVAATWCITCLAPVVNISKWLEDTMDTVRIMVLRNSTTHIAFITQNNDDDTYEYITLYDLETRNLISLLWHCLMFKRLTMPRDIGFSSHSFQYIIIVSRDNKGVRHLSIKPAWNCNPNAFPQAHPHLINIHSIIYSTLKVYEDDGHKLFDVTEPTKAIIQGCQSSRCVLTMQMFMMLFHHLFNIRQDYHSYAELQVMDGKDFTEQIFKNDDLVRINA